MEAIVNLSTLEGDDMDVLYDGQQVLLSNGEVADVQDILDAGFLLFI